MNNKNETNAVHRDEETDSVESIVNATTTAVPQPSTMPTTGEESSVAKEESEPEIDWDEVEEHEEFNRFLTSCEDLSKEERAIKLLERACTIEGKLRIQVKTTLLQAREIGQHLCQAKLFVGSGKWLAFLSEHWGSKKIRSAQNYMRIHRNWVFIKHKYSDKPGLIETTEYSIQEALAEISDFKEDKPKSNRPLHRDQKKRAPSSTIRKAASKFSAIIREWPNELVELLVNDVQYLRKSLSYLKTDLKSISESDDEDGADASSARSSSAEDDENEWRDLVASIDEEEEEDASDEESETEAPEIPSPPTKKSWTVPRKSKRRLISRRASQITA